MLYGLDNNNNDENEPTSFRGKSPVQLAHNEAMRQHQKALSQRRNSIIDNNNGNGNESLHLPKVRNVSSGTLGSPFNEQQQQQQAAVLNPTAGVVEHGNKKAGVQTVPIVKQPVPKKASSRDRAASSTTNVSAGGIGKGRPNKDNTKSKQAFPSKVDTSMNSSNTTLSGVGQTVKRTVASRTKKPPVSNSTRYNNTFNGSVRGRKASNASEKSIKKDDLLDRLADALK